MIHHDSPQSLTVATGSIWDPRCIAMNYFGNGPRFDPDLNFQPSMILLFGVAFLVSDWPAKSASRPITEKTCTQWPNVGEVGAMMIACLLSPHDILPEIIHESSQELGLVGPKIFRNQCPLRLSSIVVIKIQQFDEFLSNMFINVHETRGFNIGWMATFDVF